MNRIITVNAGGKLFQTYLTTLNKYPHSRFSKLFPALNASSTPETAQGSAPSGSKDKDQHDSDVVFLDVSPNVFEPVLNFLRSNQPIQLPTDDLALRASLLFQLKEWGLLQEAFSPPRVGEGGDEDEEAGAVVPLPDVCVVQLCDHLQHDQGVKRHAMTITYGSDGFHLRELTRLIRRDLNGQLSSTFWQCYQTGERAAFFTTTKVANGAADILTTSITQQVVSHTERLGYHLASSYVTISPDVVHTSVRMLIHNFIFRRARLASPDVGDAAASSSAWGEADGNGGEEEEGDVLETFNNF